MTDTSHELSERLQSCHEQYTLHFAGHPRVTRDPDMLVALIDEVESVRRVTRDAVVAEAAHSQVHTYREEHAAVAAAQQEAGPMGRALAHTLSRASLVMHRYTRHFAGQVRPSRDAWLLQELRGHLDGMQRTLETLKKGAGATLEDFIQMASREADAIAASRRQGTLREQAAAWGLAANTLLQSYQDHCIGRRRLAVRPALLLRLLRAIEEVLAAMQALQQGGLDVPHHAEVIVQLQQQAQAWREEHADTAKAREQAQPDTISQAISDELDDVLLAYNDASAKPEVLTRTHVGTLCDRLDELHGQLVSEPTQAATLVIAADALAMLCGHYDELPKAAT